MRNAYIRALYEMVGVNKNILAVVADNGAIVFDDLRRDFPNQFINFGIAEANMVSVSSGLASCGKIPFAYTIAGFITMRAYEQVRDDVCLQMQNVKLVGVGAGVSYATLGPTHHTMEDIAIMRVLPNMTILVPACPREAYELTKAAAKITGPVYIRLETTKEPELYDDSYQLIPGRGVMLTNGWDLTIIATGAIVYDALQAVQELGQKRISVRLINIHTVKPIDAEIIVRAAGETGAILTVEEHNIIGGLGSAVEEVLMRDYNKPIAFRKMGIQDCFCEGYGNHAQLKEALGLSANHIEQAVIDVLKSKRER